MTGSSLDNGCKVGPRIWVTPHYFQKQMQFAFCDVHISVFSLGFHIQIPWIGSPSVEESPTDTNRNMNKNSSAIFDHQGKKVTYTYSLINVFWQQVLNSSAAEIARGRGERAGNWNLKMDLNEDKRFWVGGARTVPYYVYVKCLAQWDPDLSWIHQVQS